MGPVGAEMDGVACGDVLFLPVKAEGEGSLKDGDEFLRAFLMRRGVEARPRIQLHGEHFEFPGRIEREHHI